MFGNFIAFLAGNRRARRAGAVLCAVALGLLFAASPASAHGQGARDASHPTADHASDTASRQAGAGAAAHLDVAVADHPVHGYPDQGHPDHGHAGNCNAATCVPAFLLEGTVGILPAPPMLAIADVRESPVSILLLPPLRPPRIAA